MDKSRPNSLTFGPQLIEVQKSSFFIEEMKLPNE